MTGARNNEFKTFYQPLNYDASQEEEEDNLSPEDPTDVLIHVVPPVSKKKWYHIEDLDKFFGNAYEYRQEGGFKSIVWKSLWGVGVFATIVFIFLIFTVFINFDMLFNEDGKGKVLFPDIFYSYSEITFPWYVVIALLFSALFFCVRTFYAYNKLRQHYYISIFYKNVLGINDGDLENIPWSEVQRRIMEVQVEQRMCIHKESLTELDIYHRILRFKNYFIAMVNKNVIQLKFNASLIGEVTYLTAGLRYNIDKILFTGPWAPFQNSWHLRDEFKQPENRHRLAAELNKTFVYFAVVNFILMPFIFLWQTFILLFTHSEIITKNPEALGLRRWSDYAKVTLRHFNELDHELQARLSRGYKPAVQYMDNFTSPDIAIAAQHIAFVASIIFAVTTGLAIYDEDVLLVQHWILIISVSGFVATSIRKLIPDPNMVRRPEILMTYILAETNYLPDSWKGKAHTKHVYNSFSVLFEYRACKFLEELISPIMTPFMLYFVLRPKSLEIVDFLRNFTVDVVGVGDICSFAQMDIRKHGSVTWQPFESDYIRPTNTCEENLHERMDGGKTELSLLHFTLTNPTWKPPHESSTFIAAMKTQAQKDYNDLNTVPEENALVNSMNSVSLGNGLGAIGVSLLRMPWLAAHHAIPGFQQAKANLCQLEGSRHGISSGVLGSISQSLSTSGGLIADPILNTRHDFVQARPFDMTAIDMGVSALYLHEYHNRKLAHDVFPETVVAASSQMPPVGSNINRSIRECSRGTRTCDDELSDFQYNTDSSQKS